jgi:hypothetical protein
VTSDEERYRRRMAMMLAHGKPERVGALMALNLIDRADVDLNQVIAYRYRDQGAADAWQASTLTHNGIPSLGTAPDPDKGGVIGVYDLRMAHMALGESHGKRQDKAGLADKECQGTTAGNSPHREPDKPSGYARIASYKGSDKARQKALKMDGHDLVIYGWTAPGGGTKRIAVKCTCFGRRNVREPLASGVRLLAHDAVAAWRQHLYDEGVIPREQEEEVRADAAVPRISSRRGLLRPADNGGLPGSGRGRGPCPPVSAYAAGSAVPVSG